MYDDLMKGKENTKEIVEALCGSVVRECHQTMKLMCPQRLTLRLRRVRLRFQRMSREEPILRIQRIHDRRIVQGCAALRYHCLEIVRMYGKRCERIVWTDEVLRRYKYFE